MQNATENKDLVAKKSFRIANYVE